MNEFWLANNYADGVQEDVIFFYFFFSHSCLQSEEQEQEQELLLEELLLEETTGRCSCWVSRFLLDGVCVWFLLAIFLGDRDTRTHAMLIKVCVHLWRVFVIYLSILSLRVCVHVLYVAFFFVVSICILAMWVSYWKNNSCYMKLEFFCIAIANLLYSIFFSIAI